MFELISSKKIENQLSRLSCKLKPKFLDLLVNLKAEPVPVSQYNVKKISGSENRYRVRIQSMRLIYDVEWKERKIVLLKFDRRKDRTYKKM